MVDSRVKQYFEDACDMLDSLDIKYGPITDVTVNTRVKSRWGQCTYNKVSNSFKIEISAILLKGDYRAIMDTMLHELLHAHKNRLSHTGEWKRCAELVNDCYMYDIKRATSAAEKHIDLQTTKKYKYIVTCTGCGAVSKYVRKGKVIRLLQSELTGSCTCGVCGGKHFILKEI